MSSIIKWSAISLVVAHLINCLCVALKTDFLIKFLEGNLITLLITLLAINTATIGIILIRLGEISAEHKKKFPEIISAMKCSVWEQLALIPISAFCLILLNSPVIQKSFSNVLFYLGTILIATAIYAIVAVFDTAMAAFNLNDEADKLNK